ARAAELLLRLTPFPSGLTPILAYREAFTARYGSDRAVPLLEMLDPDQGIGPPPDPNDLVPLRSPARDRMLIDIAARALHD
ncbi:lantibiotic dehydratase, partial [Mycobacterium tuberculosis]|nr:lantibiotic dehydratase [Mycobacterium tuberculosis]